MTKFIFLLSLCWSAALQAAPLTWYELGARVLQVHPELSLKAVEKQIVTQEKILLDNYFMPEVTWQSDYAQQQARDVGSQQQIQLGPRLDWQLPTGTQAQWHSYNTWHTASGIVSNQQTWGASLRLKHQVWPNPQKTLQAERKGKQLGIQRHDVEKNMLENQVLLALLSHYLELLALQQRLEIYETTLARLKQEQKVMQVQVELGKRQVLELRSFELYIEREKLQYLETQQQYAFERKKFLEDLELSEQTEIVWETPVLPEVPSEQPSETLHILKLQEKHAYLNYQKNTQIVPGTLELHADWIAHPTLLSGTQATGYTQWGVQWRLPLGSNGQAQKRKSRYVSLLEWQQSRLQTKKFIQEQQQEQVLTAQSLDHLNQKIMLSKRAVEIAEQLEKQAFLKWELGLMSTTEWLETKGRAQHAHFNLLLEEQQKITKSAWLTHVRGGVLRTWLFS